MSYNLSNNITVLTRHRNITNKLSTFLHFFHTDRLQDTAKEAARVNSTAQALYPSGRKCSRKGMVISMLA